MTLAIAITTALAAYALFIAYDLLSIRGTNPRHIPALFFAGVFLVVISTASLIAGSVELFVLSARLVIALVLAVVFLVAEIWALFFSLPKGTYSDSDEKRAVYEGGAYSLCRHPGVLFYCCFFICLFVAFPTWENAVGFGILCLGDIVYMLLQDTLTFPRLLEGYGEYKERSTMFLPQICGLRK